MKFLQSHIALIFVLALAFIAIVPFFYPGFFPIHDNTQVARVFQMYQSLQDGLFPVRWVQDLGYGYGYPIFSFYAPFAYYVGAAFMFLGFDGLPATKIMIALGFITAGVTMYFFARQIFDKWTSALVALLYVYAPYHAVNIYVRGAIAELWAYAFIPLAFLGFWLVAKRPSWRTIAIAAVGYGAIIMSHNLTALLITPFLVAWVLFLSFSHSWKKEKIVSLLVAFIFGVLLSAWYWVPAIGEMGHTNVASQAGGGSAYKDHFVCLSQLWNSQWGFGGSTSGCLDGMSFQLGKIHILLGLLGIAALFLLDKKKRPILIFMSGALLVSIFFMLHVSKPVWDLLPFMKYLQFPWRFEQPTLFYLSLLAGLGISSVMTKVRRDTKISVHIIAIIFLSLISVLFYSKLFKPQMILNPYRDEMEKKTVQWTISKISDEYLPKDFEKPKSEFEIPQLPYVTEEGILVHSYDKSTSSLRLSIESYREALLKLNVAYFPAWQVKVDNSLVTPKQDNGRIAIVLPAGQHTVTVTFVQTPIQKVANSISAISIVILILGIMKARFLPYRE